MRTTIMRALRFLVTVDRDKRIDRHIDYFGGGAALAAGVPRERRIHRHRPLDTKVQYPTRVQPRTVMHEEDAACMGQQAPTRTPAPLRVKEEGHEF
jgi:hypothetical protein